MSPSSVGASALGIMLYREPGVMASGGGGWVGFGHSDSDMSQGHLY